MFRTCCSGWEKARRRSMCFMLSQSDGGKSEPPRTTNQCLLFWDFLKVESPGEEALVLLKIQIAGNWDVNHMEEWNMSRFAWFYSRIGS